MGTIDQDSCTVKSSYLSSFRFFLWVSGMIDVAGSSDLHIQSVLTLMRKGMRGERLAFQLQMPGNYTGNGNTGAVVSSLSLRMRKFLDQGMQDFTQPRLC